MLLNGKTIDQVTEADLLSLRETQRREDQFIDYKDHGYKTTREYPTKQDKNQANERLRVSLCDDVCAFANAYGGWIICGMEEADDSSAKELNALPDFNPDDDTRRVRAIIESGTSPSIRSIDIKPIPLSAGGYALVIYVQRSYEGPHRVVENRKFRIRRLNENGEMDMQEIRRAFVGNATYVEQMRDFRRQRVEAISDFDHPDSFTQLDDGPILAVHVMPLGMIENPQRIQFTSTGKFVYEALNKHDITSPWDDTPNLNGYLLKRYVNSDKQPEYIQIFRSGAVEYVVIPPHNDDYKFPNGTTQSLIFYHQWEVYALTGLVYCVRLMSLLGINEPCYVSITAIGVKKYHWVITDRHFDPYSPVRIKHDPLLLPEQYIESWQDPIATQMKNSLDLWANTFGRHSSAHYDKQGNWRYMDNDDFIVPKINP